MSDWNDCSTTGCNKKARYRGGKLCHACQKRREVSGESHRASAMAKPWNYCKGLVTPGCRNRATYRGGSQCASCSQKKYCRKIPEHCRQRCNTYYWLNRDKERARRRAYYQAHREEEIVNATLRRYNRTKKKKAQKCQSI